MTARAHLLDVLGDLYAGLAAVKVEAEEEGDVWTGHAAEWIEQGVRDAADRAEADRLVREGGS